MTAQERKDHIARLRRRQSSERNGRTSIYLDEREAVFAELDHLTDAKVALVAALKLARQYVANASALAGQPGIAADLATIDDAIALAEPPKAKELTSCLTKRNSSAMPPWRSLPQA